jgi:hypothetical protein
LTGQQKESVPWQVVVRRSGSGRYLSIGFVHNSFEVPWGPWKEPVFLMPAWVKFGIIFNVVVRLLVSHFVADPEI